MDSRTEGLLRERLQIVESIRDIQVEQSVALRQVQVPDSTFKLAKDFIKKVPNSLIFNNQQLYLRYEILHCIDVISNEGIYDLLARDAGRMSVKDSNQKMTDWLDATKCLLRYALNLFLAPKRPEFQNIKVCAPPCAV